MNCSNLRVTYIFEQIFLLYIKFRRVGFWELTRAMKSLKAPRALTAVHIFFSTNLTYVW